MASGKKARKTHEIPYLLDPVEPVEMIGLVLTTFSALTSYIGERLLWITLPLSTRFKS